MGSAFQLPVRILITLTLAALLLISFIIFVMASVSLTHYTRLERSISAQSDKPGPVIWGVPDNISLAPQILDILSTLGLFPTAVFLCYTVLWSFPRSEKPLKRQFFMHSLYALHVMTVLVLATVIASYSMTRTSPSFDVVMWAALTVPAGDSAAVYPNPGGLPFTLREWTCSISQYNWQDGNFSGSMADCDIARVVDAGMVVLMLGCLIVCLLMWALRPEWKRRVGVVREEEAQVRQMELTKMGGTVGVVPFAVQV